MRLFSILLLFSGSLYGSSDLVGSSNSPELSSIRIMQLRRDGGSRIRYPDALPSLLELMNKQARVGFDPDPLMIESLTDERLFEHPILYLNCDELPKFEFSEEENEALRRYLTLGGFLYLDAGIKASFLGTDMGHSYAAWEERVEVRDWFTQLFPDKLFAPLPRNHEIFRTFYQGLPDNEYLQLEKEQKRLPDTVLTFVEQEKWPQATYSFVGMKVNGRLACVASPICAMGWGMDEFGSWIPPISFRIRESAEDFDETLKLASFEGKTYEVTREDGLKDVIYTIPGKRPLWVREPTGRWRIFKYYSGEEISDYAHSFYARLGMNVFLYALLN
jgi:hypothetical protein